MTEDSLREGLKAQIREAIAKKPNAVQFSQGHHDALVKTLPAILSGMFRATAEAQAREIGELKRQIEELKTRDARRLEIIKEAVETAKGRGLVTKAEELNQDAAEHGGNA